MSAHSMPYKKFFIAIITLMPLTTLCSEEIEIKFQLDAATCQAFKTVLKTITGSSGSVSNQTDTYILPQDLPMHDGYYDPQEFIRLRQDSKKGALITYKQIHRDALTTTHRTELETKIGDVQTMTAIITLLMPQSQEIIIKKEREKYTTNYKGAKLEIVFDVTEGLGNFIEIELKSEIGVDEGRALIKDFLKSHGVATITEITKNYIHLALNPAHQQMFQQTVVL